MPKGDVNVMNAKPAMTNCKTDGIEERRRDGGTVCGLYVVRGKILASQRRIENIYYLSQLHSFRRELATTVRVREIGNKCYVCVLH